MFETEAIKGKKRKEISALGTWFVINHSMKIVNFVEFDMILLTV